MKNKGFIITLILFLAFSFSLNVYADEAAIENVSPAEHVNALKQVYNSGPKEIIIPGSSDIVKVYGKSVCNSADRTCQYSYYSNSDLDEYFKNYLVCSNGATSIGYSTSSAATGASSAYKGAYTGTENITVYWSEEYNVECLTGSSNGSGFDNTVQLENTGNSSGNISGNYPSSDTEDNVDTGVFTYYVVLAFIAAGAYALLIMSKKHNFFKKI